MRASTQLTYAQVQEALNKATNGGSVEIHLEFIYKRDLEAKELDRQREVAIQQRLEKLKATDTSKLTKKEIIDLTWQLPELPDNMYDLLTEEGGFITGSSVTSNIESAKDEDWCIMLPPNVFYEWCLGTSNEGYWESDGFSTVYCHRNGVLLNIICFSDANLFTAWFAATNVLKIIKDNVILPPKFSAYGKVNVSDMLAVKWKRVAIFRAIKDAFYEPHVKKPMDKELAFKLNKCSECSREAIYFTCRAARDYYNANCICERCSGIEY